MVRARILTHAAGLLREGLLETALDLLIDAMDNPSIVHVDDWKDGVQSVVARARRIAEFELTGVLVCDYDLRVVMP